MEWLIGVLAAAGLIAIYAAWLAGRIARLHARVAAAHVALDAQLIRRATAATALAHSQRLARAAAADRVCAAAKACLQAHPADREALENDLTRALAELAIDPDDPVADELLAASRRLALARQVHNDAVRDTLSLRGARLPRALRLGRRHPVPVYFDIAEPTELTRPALAPPVVGVGEATPGAGSPH